MSVTHFVPCSQELSGEVIEAARLPWDNDRLTLSPSLHFDECLSPPFITSTTYCTAAIMPSMMLHTASPIAMLSELSVGSSLFADVIHSHRYLCMRFAK